MLIVELENDRHSVGQSRIEIDSDTGDDDDSDGYQVKYVERRADQARKESC